MPRLQLTMVIAFLQISTLMASACSCWSSAAVEQTLVQPESTPKMTRLPPNIEIKYSGLHNSVGTYRSSDRTTEERYLDRVKKADQTCDATDVKDRNSASVNFRVVFFPSKTSGQHDVRVISSLKPTSPWRACVERAISREFNAINRQVKN